jgi:hypothetical protein
MDMKPARIRLHIDELIVNGVTVGDRDAVGDAIRSELTRLLTAHALPSAFTRTRQIASLNAGAVQVASPRAEVLGTKVAQAVHGSFRKPDVA